jgi:hypothetical protein
METHTTCNVEMSPKHSNYWLKAHQHEYYQFIVDENWLSPSHWRQQEQLFPAESLGGP